MGSSRLTTILAVVLALCCYMSMVSSVSSQSRENSLKVLRKMIKRQREEFVEGPGDLCEGEACECPPGMIGKQPFCRTPEPEPPVECKGEECEIATPAPPVECEGEECEITTPVPPVECEGEECEIATPKPLVECEGNECEIATPEPLVVCEGEECEIATPVPPVECEGEECEIATPKPLVECEGNECDTASPLPTGNPLTCVEGSTKMIDCNSCRCAGGTWACTLKRCIDDPEPTENVPDPGPTHLCKEAGLDTYDKYYCGAGRTIDGVKYGPSRHGCIQSGIYKGWCWQTCETWSGVGEQSDNWCYSGKSKTTRCNPEDPILVSGKHCYEQAETCTSMCYEGWAGRE